MEKQRITEKHLNLFVPLFRPLQDLHLLLFPLPHIIYITTTSTAEPFTIIQKKNSMKMTQVCCMGIALKAVASTKSASKLKKQNQNRIIQLHLETSDNISTMLI